MSGLRNDYMVFVLVAGGGDMPDTIIENILNPKYQKEYRFSDLDEKVSLCRELKALETEIASQLDREHKKLFRRYTEGWDKLHTEISIDTFANGLNEIRR